MRRVNIYIYSSIKTIRKNSGAAGYVLSYITKNNKEATLSKIEYLENMTRNESELEILNKALSRLTVRDIEICIYTDSTYLSSALKQHWIEKWQQSDWKNAKEEPVKHAEKWQQMLILLNSTSVYINTDHHEYSNWLINQCKKKGPDNE